jgi:hypothetical protein
MEMTDSARREQLLKLWLERPVEERTDTDIVIFYRWLQENHPDFLKKGHGDPYQHLRVDVTGHAN